MTPPWPNADVETLKRLWSQGMAAAQICSAFSWRYSRSAICGKVHRLGLDTRDPAVCRHPVQRAKASKPKPIKIARPQTADGTEAKDTAIVLSEPEPTGPLEDFPAASCCRWIAGDVRAGGWRCCGAPIVDHTSWCAFHRPRVMTKPYTTKISAAR